MSQGVLVSTISGSIARVLTTAPLAARRHHRAGRSTGSNRRCRRLGDVHDGFLLGLHDVLLVADPLVPEPIANLRYSNSTLSSKLLLCLLAGVGVGQMGVEVLVQHLARLLAEVPALSPGVQESGAVPPL